MDATTDDRNPRKTEETEETEETDKTEETVDKKVELPCRDFFDNIPRLLETVVNAWNEKSADKEFPLAFGWDYICSGPNVFYGQSMCFMLVFDMLPEVLLTPWGKIQISGSGSVPTNYKECIEHVISVLGLDKREKNGQKVYAWSSEWPTGKPIGSYNEQLFHAVQETWRTIWDTQTKSIERQVCACCSHNLYTWR